MAVKTAGARQEFANMVVCVIRDGDSILLKKATRGMSEGKWVSPGGKVEYGETLVGAAQREVREETGLAVRDLAYVGYKVFMQGVEEYEVNYFSTATFTGKLRSTAEGAVRWFHEGDIPYKEMWPEERFVLPLILRGERFFRADVAHQPRFYGHITAGSGSYLFGEGCALPVTLRRNAYGISVSEPEGYRLALINPDTGKPAIPLM